MIKTILIDIDDTIENLLEVWCDLLNKTYKTNINYEDVTDWDVSKFFPELTKSQVYSPLESLEIWKNIRPKDGAVKYVKKLINDGFEVFLCTSTSYKNIKPKFEFVKKYFPYIKWKNVIVTSNKQMINADCLVDDGVHNLEGGTYIKILMTAPHNRKYNAKENGMYRVGNWREVYELIKELSK